MDNSYIEKRKSEFRWRIIISLFFLALLFGCLGLVLFNADPGSGSDLTKSRYTFHMGLNQQPDCPPDIPCPPGPPTAQNHLTFWVYRSVREGSGYRTEYHRIVDLPLWR